MLWNHSNNLKLYDKVIIKRSYMEGFIDTITPDGQYRIRTKEGYEWCNSYEIMLNDGSIKKNEPKNKTKFDYL